MKLGPVVAAGNGGHVVAGGDWVEAGRLGENRLGKRHGVKREVRHVGGEPLLRHGWPPP
jgi:hypothetical protein